MDYVFDEWKKILDTFQSSVTKDLEEIRQCKADIQKMKTDFFNRLEKGKYYRDESRIVISAPEIVIGNVDSSGDLIPGGGTVVVKGSQVMLDGVGPAGSVRSRASSISQIAVDPGPDGMEAVVYPTSAVVSQARNITLQSNDAKDCFSQTPLLASGCGIRIHADQSLEIEAALSAKTRGEQIESSLKALDGQKSELEKDASKYKGTLDSIYDKLKMALAKQELLNADADLTRTNFIEIEELANQVEDLMPGLYESSLGFIRSVAQLAEANRQIKALKAEKDDIKADEDFKKNTTGATLSVRSEFIEVSSTDGDGNLHENEEAGICINTPRMDVAMQREDGSLVEKGEMNIRTENFNLSTANPKISDDSSEYPAAGKVTVTSKDITLQAVDTALKDEKMEEKALSKDGKILMRAEKMELSATDTEGNATGCVGINGKAVSLRSMDVDKEKRTDKSLAKDSTMLLLSEKMYVGARDKSNKSKKVQAVSEEMGLFADKTLEAQQGDGKAVVQLTGGNAAVSGSKTQVYGATTINGKTEVKDEVKAPKATIDNLEAKTSLKSPNISDGIAISVPATPSSLSTQLKTEDAPKES